ncbi:ABC transporter permease [Microbacterium aoyamense]|uniref:Transport permease protein n=1 Tax=Microbacterium aoyamense TaxID=344166 RepID=A0ABN2PVA6_9MICO|nr:ABC transporter permease [Microbacterium aoyamense]
MSVVLGIVGRNLRLFFRDRLNVFFSLLSGVILFLLYTLFLARLQIDGLSESFPQASEAQVLAFIDSWMFSGIVLLTTVTAGMGAMSQLVEDGQSGRFKDFLVSPILRGQLVLGYLISAVVVAVIMSSVVLVLSVLYLGIFDHAWLPFDRILKILLFTVLCCFAFTALSAFVVSFVKTPGAFSAFATVVGTILGFVAGAYIPIGSLPVAVGNVINALPFAQGAMLLRREFTADTLGTLTDVPQATEAVRGFYGIDAYVGDALVTPWVAIGVLLLFAIGFTSLAAGRIRSRIR